jgi:hypothetical protein
MSTLLVIETSPKTMVFDGLPFNLKLDFLIFWDRDFFFDFHCQSLNRIFGFYPKKLSDLVFGYPNPDQN